MQVCDSPRTKLLAAEDIPDHPTRASPADNEQIKGIVCIERSEGGSMGAGYAQLGLRNLCFEGLLFPHSLLHLRLRVGARLIHVAAGIMFIALSAVRGGFAPGQPARRDALLRLRIETVPGFDRGERAALGQEFAAINLCILLVIGCLSE